MLGRHVHEAFAEQGFYDGFGSGCDRGVGMRRL